VTIFTYHSTSCYATSNSKLLDYYQVQNIAIVIRHNVTEPGEDIGVFFLFRSLELLFRGNEIVSRSLEILTRGNEKNTDVLPGLCTTENVHRE